MLDSGHGGGKDNFAIMHRMGDQGERRMHLIGILGGGRVGARKRVRDRAEGRACGGGEESNEEDHGQLTGWWVFGAGVETVGELG